MVVPSPTIASLFHASKFTGNVGQVESPDGIKKYGEMPLLSRVRRI
jgi:hypothetical protein